MRGPLEHFGRTSHVADRNVLIVGPDTVHVANDSPIGPQFAHAIQSDGTTIGELSRKPGFVLGWARMQFNPEVLYFYDCDDEDFGLAHNLTAPRCGEWGCSPFKDAA